MSTVIYDPDDPRVVDGTYDIWGYNLKERIAIARNMKRKRCDHKFIDSTGCLKCGWIPPETKA